MVRLWILFILALVLTALVISFVDVYVNKNKKYIEKIVIIVLPFLIFYLGLFTTIPLEYSKGERSGTLIKLSHKGFLFKTYEGKLKLGNEYTGDAGSNIFTFSVYNEKIAKDLNRYIGKHVKLNYVQYPLVSIINGETSYNVTKIKGDN